MSSHPLLFCDVSLQNLSGCEPPQCTEMSDISHFPVLWNAPFCVKPQQRTNQLTGSTWTCHIQLHTQQNLRERKQKRKKYGWESHWVFTLICVILRTNPSCKFNTDLARNVDEESEKNHCALHSGKRKSLASFSNAKIQTNITFCDTCSFLPLQE